MSDDRFRSGREKLPKKNITLREYLERVVSESGRSNELQEAIKLLTAPVFERVLSGEKLKNIHEIASKEKEKNS